MKIISIIKQVPDAEARIRASADGVDLDGVSFVIDGMDEYGVEEALRL
ncbi:MAG: electron transfer flavoprotein subunit beta, partial [Deinococcota bacterium]|nr:electron transfer flavoprotein subunit beta [Deinococcota bacterium]